MPEVIAARWCKGYDSYDGCISYNTKICVVERVVKLKHYVPVIGRSWSRTQLQAEVDSHLLLWLRVNEPVRHFKMHNVKSFISFWSKEKSLNITLGKSFVKCTCSKRNVTCHLNHVIPYGANCWLWKHSSCMWVSSVYYMRYTVPFSTSAEALGHCVLRLKLHVLLQGFDFSYLFFGSTFENLKLICKLTCRNP